MWCSGVVSGLGRYLHSLGSLYPCLGYGLPYARIISNQMLKTNALRGNFDEKMVQLRCRKCINFHIKNLNKINSNLIRDISSQLDKRQSSQLCAFLKQKNFNL